MGGRGQNPKSDLRMKVWTLFFKIFASGGGWEKKGGSFWGGRARNIRIFGHFRAGHFCFSRMFLGILLESQRPPCRPRAPRTPRQSIPNGQWMRFFIPGGARSPISFADGGAHPPREHKSSPANDKPIHLTPPRATRQPLFGFGKFTPSNSKNTPAQHAWTRTPGNVASGGRISDTT